MEKACSVYIMECAGAVKIGIAHHLTQRLADLQTANPFDVTIAHSIQVKNKREAIRIERTLHSRFIAFRLKGEWFAISVRDAIDALDEVEVDVPAPVIPRAYPPMATTVGISPATYSDDDEDMAEMRRCAEILDFTKRTAA